MEIERKYLVSALPEHLENYPVRTLEQAYLCTDPVVRVRRDGERFELTYKSSGLMVREEYTLPLTQSSYSHLKAKADGRIISKKRYLIPLNETLTIELDIFSGDLTPLVIAEVEFPDEEAADTFIPPEWFGEDVTFDSAYHNSNLSKIK